jgi:hypothetical protein
LSINKGGVVETANGDSRVFTVLLSVSAAAFKPQEKGND